jgi:hypothetical protein
MNYRSNILAIAIIAILFIIAWLAMTFIYFQVTKANGQMSVPSKVIPDEYLTDRDTAIGWLASDCLQFSINDNPDLITNPFINGMCKMAAANMYDSYYLPLERYPDY